MFMDTTTLQNTEVVHDSHNPGNQNFSHLFIEKSYWYDRYYELIYNLILLWLLGIVLHTKSHLKMLWLGLQLMQ